MESSTSLQSSCTNTFLATFTTLALSPPSHLHHPHSYTTLAFTPPSLLHHPPTCTTLPLTPPSHLHHPHSYTTLTLTPPSLLHHPPTYTTLTLTPPSLSQLLTDTAVTGGSPVYLITLYQKLYGSAVHQSILRYHDFSDFATYFVQKV